MIGALISPSIERLVEHWFISFGLNLDKKGYKFEKYVIDSLNEQLIQNRLINDFDKAVGKRIKTALGEEEFDLLVRIDDLIIIAESKSIVTTDSAISQYRTADILSRASLQVIRKTAFLKENLQDVFINLGWVFDKNVNYKFAECIVNSSRIFVGHKFNGIPVIDSDILSDYFESPIRSLMSKYNGNGEFKDIAWYELYNDLNGLKDNFQTYICNVPQINEDSESFEYCNFNIPYINQSSYKITYSRLIIKNTDPRSFMTKKHHFKLVTSDDYEIVSSQIDAVV